MTDVFLSYARTERAKAERIKALLEGMGLVVFFDIEGLDGGDVFPDVLDREVKSAGCVLGLWSPYALSRPWIRTECLIGKDRGVLVPVSIEPIDPLRDVPVAFYGVQHIDLSTFNGDSDSPEWRRVARAVARVLKRPELAPPLPAGAKAEPFTVQPAQSRRSGRPNAMFLAIGVVAAVLVGAGAIWALDPLGWGKSSPASASNASPTAPSSGSTTMVPAAVSDRCPPIKVTVYFQWEKANLTTEGWNTLRDAVPRAADGCYIERINVFGYDDMVAPPDLAQAMSRSRAQTVATALATTGLLASAIHAEGKGNSELEVQTERGVKEPRNRRAVVEFQRWPAGDTSEALYSQTTRLAMVKALPGLTGGKSLTDSSLNHREVVTAVRQIGDLQQVASGRGDLSAILGWDYAEGITVSADPMTAAGYFQDSCKAREPAGCVGFARLVSQGKAGVSRDEARSLLEQACTQGVAAACTTR